MKPRSGKNAVFAGIVSLGMFICTGATFANVAAPVGGGGDVTVKNYWCVFAPIHSCFPQTNWGCTDSNADGKCDSSVPPPDGGGG
jgi:hypothetical protein